MRSLLTTLTMLALLSLPLAAASPSLAADATFNSGTIKAGAAVGGDDTAPAGGATAECTVNAPGEAFPVTLEQCGTLVNAGGQWIRLYPITAKCPYCGEDLEWP